MIVWIRREPLRGAALMLTLVFLSTVGILGHSAASNDNLSSRMDKVLLLDVDNTLYAETEHNIEKQIVGNIHKFCENHVRQSDHMPMSPSQADDLHHAYGSTIEGLRQTLWKDLSADELTKRMKLFYEEVYDGIRVDSLIPTYRNDGDTKVTGTNTGYTHQRRIQDRLRRLWKSSPHTIHIASNSPRKHIASVLQAMGLCSATTRNPHGRFLTPDSVPGFPTKLDPDTFFSSVQSQDHERILLDDSTRTLDACPPQIQGILIDNNNNNRNGLSLDAALSQTVGWLDPDYEFSQVRYLQAKNQVDFAALDRQTWEFLREKVQRLQTSELVIVDVGAGLLSMLRLVLEGHNDSMPSLMTALQGTDTIQYYAYEPNLALKSSIEQELKELGFVPVGMAVETTNGHPEQAFRRTSSDGRSVVLHLRFWDYQEPSPRLLQPTPHLIIGCCFADLLDPKELATSLVKTFLSRAGTGFDHTLVYFPITFRGITQFVPSRPFDRGIGKRTIPSDTSAFSFYSKALSQQHGHNLDPERLIDALKDYGAELLSQGRSKWIIDPNTSGYLWETMLYFFATVVGNDLQEVPGWDAAGWFTRARSQRPSIHVSNVDLLLSIPHLGKWRLPVLPLSQDHDAPSCTDFEEIQFTAPQTVGTIKRRSHNLERNQVRIKSVASLVSSGTELKIFNGVFDDAVLDVNIVGMEDERMKYPLAYGYSLVGRVTECGEDVNDADDILGKLVFTFSAHASEVVIDRSAIQVVPEGINPLDAVFMPSVETALALVHDTNPRFGETVAVFGQGLIGLLVTAVLARQKFDATSGEFGTVSTFDTIDDRLAASAYMGASQALHPDQVTAAGPFDATIEVSGNGHALQSAIDSTRDGGRVVIGSWYGKNAINLKLGIDFHRSHKQIKASQVSNLPAEMTMTWSKDRRFALTWELVRDIRPSQLITKKAGLSECQDVYNALASGKETAAAFLY